MAINRISELAQTIGETLKELKDEIGNVNIDVFSGTIASSATATTQTSTDSSTKIATTAFVKNAFDAVDALQYKGTINGSATAPGRYTSSANKGWVYKVASAGYVNGVKVEVGDILICNTDSTASATSSNYSTVSTKWDVIQNNVDVFKGATASASGAIGLVPVASSTDADKFLKGDGTWATVESGDKTSYDATTITTGTTTTITKDSDNYITITISSATYKLTFTPAENTVYAEKLIHLTSTYTGTDGTKVTYTGGTFANSEIDPVWGLKGYHLLLKATFIGGRVILNVLDNDQCYYNVTGIKDWKFDLPSGYVVSDSGRAYYRHSSGKGTVMAYPTENGVNQLLILDRQYRNSKQFGTYQVDTPLTNYNTSNGQSYGYLPSTATLTEEELKNYSTTDYRNNGGTTDGTNNYTYFEDTNTAKQNCDVWMTYVGQEDNTSSLGGSYTNIVGVPAVEWCRSITVDGVPCDLPNIQQMIRIWLDREVIESLDQSTTTSYKLTSKKWWWSSTEYSSNYCWYVNYGGYVDYSLKGNALYVCPVLELNS